MTERVLADSELGVGGSASRSKASEGLRSAAKFGLRKYSMATAASRTSPELVIIGAKRGGTTSAWKHVSEHPGFLPLFPARQKIKGTYYLADHFNESPEWYSGHFPTERTRKQAEREVGHGVFSAEASPYYLFHPLAAQRSLVACPNAVFVAVLRDPVERAFSHWKERRANGTESLSFLDALLAEEERLGDSEARLIRGEITADFAHRHQSYLGQSMYAEAISRWQEAVGDRLQVWISDDFHADPDGHLQMLWRQLGLPDGPPCDAKAYNAHPGSDLDPKARTFLEGALGNDVQALEKLLGRSLPWMAKWTSGASAAGDRA